MTFYVPAASPRTIYEHAHESSVYVLVPLTTLSLFAIALGYISSDLYRGIGSDFISHAAPINAVATYTIDAEFVVPTGYKLIQLIGTVLGSVISYIMYLIGHTYISRLLSVPLARSVYRYLSHQ